MKRMRWMTWMAAMALVGCADGPASGNGSGASSGEEGGEDASTSESGADSTGGTSDEDGSSTGNTDPDGEPEFLTPQEHLVRISMALRGTRPSLDDLDAVRDDPSLVPDYVDAYMDGPGFEETIRDLHNDAFHTDAEGQLPALGPLSDVQPFVISESVMATATRLAERIVVEDRPYSELVTGDTWVIDDIVAEVYGIDDGGSGWREVSIPGDRPAAGILSDNAFFLRHESARANFHRGRANAVSSALLCLDYEDNNIELDDGVELSDPEAVAMALTTNPACMACHETLDPLASHFFAYPGNPMANDITAYPLGDFYVDGLADGWQDTTGRAPAYFGEETADVGELGEAIAADPRFSACAARRFQAYFMRMRIEDVPEDIVESLQVTFEESDLQARALVREIVLSDAFRVAAAASEADADDVHGYLRARPFQLARLMEDLTGFRWELDVQLLQPTQGAGVIDFARSSAIGFQVLGGSGDSLTVFESVDTTNATTSLFLRQLAAESASFVVEQDAQSNTPRLLADGIVSDDDAVRAQLVHLFERIYGERVEPDSEDVGDALTLFNGVLDASGDPARAWKATLTAMLRDLDILFY